MQERLAYFKTLDAGASTGAAASAEEHAAATKMQAMQRGRTARREKT